jgi:GntR family transcriptional regulator, mannosyl-D-glycerate transport/metabolism system repressor
MFMAIDVVGKKKHVIEYLLDKINTLSLSPGDKLDTEVSISKAMGVTRATVREATRYLVDNNLVYRVKGSGLYVGSPTGQLSKTIHALSPFDIQAHKKGVNSRRKVVSFSVIEISSVYISHGLKLKPKDKVFFIERLMFFGDQPVALEQTYIPITVISDIEINEIEQSKYSYIESKTGKLIKTRDQNITAFNLLDSNVSNLLEVKLGQAMIELREIVYFDDNTPFEYNVAIINSSKFNIHQISKLD